MGTPDLGVRILSTGDEAQDEVGYISLVADLRELGVQPEVRREPAPRGAKGVGDVAQLVVAIAASPVLLQVVKVIQAWVLAKAGRAVEVTGPRGTLKITGRLGKNELELAKQLIDDARDAEE